MRGFRRRRRRGGAGSGFNSGWGEVVWLIYVPMKYVAAYWGLVNIYCLELCYFFCEIICMYRTAESLSAAMRRIERDTNVKFIG